MSEEYLKWYNGMLSDRDYPFGTILFLFTIPLNVVFLFGGLINGMFDYNGLINLIPLPFLILNFGITICALFYVSQNREWSESCF